MQEPARSPASPQELAALDLDEYLLDPVRKQSFVTPMFEHIAPRYDAFTRLFSFGMDATWKRELMAWFDERAPEGAMVVDVACGTGDLALSAARLRPRGSVHGIDAAQRMIARARERVSARDRERVHFSAGDLTRLPFADASVDVILGGYALRNVPRYEQALGELHRVLRPGGTLLTLDFYRPPHAPWRALFLGYLQLSGSLVAWWWHRAPVIYNYIAHSIRHFVTAEEFARAMERAGFTPGRQRDHLLGGIALHEGVRP
ncbi:MAG: ubiquinone/menaquinone biosynthesis methyltransferase [Gemmatimonadaceae bacterium]|nr:ubiquinone/menaquinone biosynthesis methyltransferase [Gemmatimonadaceae bacterium]